MTAAELRAIAKNFGASVATMASALDISARTYRRFTAGTIPIPPGVAEAARRLRQLEAPARG